MERIVELLNEKNQFLEKFYRLNEIELLNLGEGNLENIEYFYSTREGILSTMRKIDKMIDESGSFVDDPKNISAENKRAILKSLEYKNEVVTQILSQDLQILSYIEEAKSDIIRELSQVKMARKAFGAYHGGRGTPQADEEV